MKLMFTAHLWVGKKPIIHLFLSQLWREGHGSITTTPFPLLSTNNEMWHKVSSMCLFLHLLSINTQARFVIRQNKHHKLNEIILFWVKWTFWQELQDQSSFLLTFINLNDDIKRCFKNHWLLWGQGEGNNLFVFPPAIDAQTQWSLCNIKQKDAMCLALFFVN